MPFPFVEVETAKSRPALILSADMLGPRSDLFIAAMIMSSRREAWGGDIDVDDLELANLPIPSVVRTAKIMTLALGDARFVGRVSLDVLLRATGELQRRLTLAQH